MWGGGSAHCHTSLTGRTPCSGDWHRLLFHEGGLWEDGGTQLTTLYDNLSFQPLSVPPYTEGAQTHETWPLQEKTC